MFNFSKFLKKNSLEQDPKLEVAPKYPENTDVATAEYSFFYIHQIKPWEAWSINQEEVAYTLDSPLYLQ
jgi:hypothetical protein